MYSFRSFQLLESRRKGGPIGISPHTDIDPSFENNEKIVGHAEHVADYSLHSTEARDTALDMLHHANNNERHKTEISKKIEGDASVAIIKPPKKARIVRYKGGGGTPFKERDVAALDRIHGPGGSKPKPGLYGALRPIVKGRSRIPRDDGSWKGAQNKAIIDNKQTDATLPHQLGNPQNPALGTNVVTYVNRHGNVGNKEILHIPVAMHPEETNISPRHRAEIQNHIDTARKWSEGHTDKHLVDEEGGRHAALKHDGKDLLAHYMNSTTDSGKAATADDFIKHVHAEHEKKITELTAEGEAARNDPNKSRRVDIKLTNARAKQAAAISHINKHKDNFNRTFAIHREMQHAQNKLAVAIGEASHKSRKNPWVMFMTHPFTGVRHPTRTGEGVMLRHRETGLLGKVVGRSSNNAKESLNGKPLADRDNFGKMTRLNREKFKR